MNIMDVNDERQCPLSSIQMAVVAVQKVSAMLSTQASRSCLE